MPITMTCDCSRIFRVRDELAGRKIRCPGCREVLFVPEPAPEPEEEEVLEALPVRSARAPKPSRESIQEKRPLRQEPEEEAEEAPERPRRKRRRPASFEKSPPVAFERGWFGSVNGGVVGGLLMILIAVVWFGLGLMGGIIFFYPPILFVIGFIALIKGLAGGQ